MTRILLVLCALAAWPGAARAEIRPTDPEADRTGAPYFVVDAERGDAEALPLAATRSTARIAGTIAHVRVTQVYRNRGPKPLEATYVFPGSTRAAVFAMRMKVGERTVEAKIQTKEDARKTYAQAKAAGKAASLLEQHRPNVFQMHVANIMPGDRVEVQLDYVEMLAPDAGVYELVIPSVVGPRYAGDQGPGTSAPNESWIKNPYVSKSDDGQPLYTWGVDVKIDAGMPIAGLRSPSHKIAPRFRGEASVGLAALEKDGGDRDFVLRYRLTGDRIQSGLLLLPGDDGQEQFFAMTMMPPRRPQAAQLPPREYVFVVDVSGSMNGFPLDTAKGLMNKLLTDLKPTDRFNVLLFAGGNRVLSERSLPATKENVARAVRAIDRERGGGGTRLLPALNRALALPRRDGMSTSIVVVTDGYVAIEQEAFDLIRRRLDEANLFAFGIGRSVNRHLIEGLARAGMGEPFVVLDGASAADTATRFRRYIESPVLTDIGVHFDGFAAYDVEPATIPDLFAERPVLLFGKYRGPAKGHINVEGRNAQGRFRRSMAVASATKDRSLVALKYLWARHRIRDLSDRLRFDRTGSARKEVTDLGLKYSLMTNFTSFVAVDDRIRNSSGDSTIVQQPLPTPKGVNPPGKLMAQFKSTGLSVRGAGSAGGGEGRAVRRRATAQPTAPVRAADQPRLRAKPKDRPTREPSPVVPAVDEEAAKEDGTARASTGRDMRSVPRRLAFGPVTVKPADKAAWAKLASAILGAESALNRCFARHRGNRDHLEGWMALKLQAKATALTVRWSKRTGRPAFDRCAAAVLSKLDVPATTHPISIPLHVRMRR